MSDDAEIQLTRSDEPALGDSPLVAFLARNTSQPGVSGICTFRNPGPGYTGNTVWFNNGANGRSNFVLPPGTSHGIHVQTGDTYSTVAGNVEVPTNAPRYWCPVDN